MYVDCPGAWPPPEPKPSPSPPPRLTPRGERVLLWLLGANLLLLLVAPIGGATLIGAVLRWMH
jgi:hypothetical protein